MTGTKARFRMLHAELGKIKQGKCSKAGKSNRGNWRVKKLLFVPTAKRRAKKKKKKKKENKPKKKKAVIIDMQAISCMTHTQAVVPLQGDHNDSTCVH